MVFLAAALLLAALAVSEAGDHDMLAVCTGHGAVTNGACVCNSGWLGSLCSVVRPPSSCEATNAQSGSSGTFSDGNITLVNFAVNTSTPFSDSALTAVTVDVLFTPTDAFFSVGEVDGDELARVFDDTTLDGLGALYVCGNGVLEPGEMCDDDNTASSDGCSASCWTEAGFACSTPQSFSASSLAAEHSFSAFGGGPTACVADAADAAAVTPASVAVGVPGYAVTASLQTHTYKHRTGHLNVERPSIRLSYVVCADHSTAGGATNVRCPANAFHTALMARTAPGLVSRDDYDGALHPVGSETHSDAYQLCSLDGSQWFEFAGPTVAPLASALQSTITFGTVSSSLKVEDGLSYSLSVPASSSFGLPKTVTTVPCSSVLSTASLTFLAQGLPDQVTCKLVPDLASVSGCMNDKSLDAECSCYGRLTPKHANTSLWAGLNYPDKDFIYSNVVTTYANGTVVSTLTSTPQPVEFDALPAGKYCACNTPPVDPRGGGGDEELLHGYDCSSVPSSSGAAGWPCSGHGVSVYETCVCDEGWSGADCGVSDRYANLYPMQGQLAITRLRSSAGETEESLGAFKSRIANVVTALEVTRTSISYLPAPWTHTEATHAALTFHFAGGNTSVPKSILIDVVPARSPIITGCGRQTATVTIPVLTPVSDLSVFLPNGTTAYAQQIMWNGTDAAVSNTDYRTFSFAVECSTVLDSTALASYTGTSALTNSPKCFFNAQPTAFDGVNYSSVVVTGADPAKANAGDSHHFADFVGLPGSRRPGFKAESGPRAGDSFSLNFRTTGAPFAYFQDAGNMVPLAMRIGPGKLATTRILPTHVEVPFTVLTAEDYSLAAGLLVSDLLEMPSASSPSCAYGIGTLAAQKLARPGPLLHCGQPIACDRIFSAETLPYTATTCYLSARPGLHAETGAATGGEKCLISFSTLEGSISSITTGARYPRKSLAPNTALTGLAEPPAGASGVVDAVTKCNSRVLQFKGVVATPSSTVTTTGELSGTASRFRGSGLSLPFASPTAYAGPAGLRVRCHDILAGLPEGRVQDEAWCRLYPDRILLAELGHLVLARTVITAKGGNRVQLNALSSFRVTGQSVCPLDPVVPVQVVLDAPHEVIVVSGGGAGAAGCTTPAVLLSGAGSRGRGAAANWGAVAWSVQDAAVSGSSLDVSSLQALLVSLSSDPSSPSLALSASGVEGGAAPSLSIDVGSQLASLPAGTHSLRFTLVLESTLNDGASVNNANASVLVSVTTASSKASAPRRPSFLAGTGGPVFSAVDSSGGAASSTASGTVKVDRSGGGGGKTAHIPSRVLAHPCYSTTPLAYFYSIRSVTLWDGTTYDDQTSHAAGSAAAAAMDVFGDNGAAVSASKGRPHFKFSQTSVGANVREFTVGVVAFHSATAAASGTAFAAGGAAYTQAAALTGAASAEGLTAATDVLDGVLSFAVSAPEPTVSVMGATGVQPHSSAVVVSCAAAGVASTPSFDFDMSVLCAVTNPDQSTSACPASITSSLGISSSDAASYRHRMVPGTRSMRRRLVFTPSAVLGINTGVVYRLTCQLDRVLRDTGTGVELSRSSAGSASTDFSTSAAPIPRLAVVTLVNRALRAAGVVVVSGSDLVQVSARYGAGTVKDNLACSWSASSMVTSSSSSSSSTGTTVDLNEMTQFIMDASTGVTVLPGALVEGATYTFTLACSDTTGVAGASASASASMAVSAKPWLSNPSDVAPPTTVLGSASAGTEASPATAYDTVFTLSAPAFTTSSGSGSQGQGQVQQAVLQYRYLFSTTANSRKRNWRTLASSSGGGDYTTDTSVSGFTLPPGAAATGRLVTLAVSACEAVGGGGEGMACSDPEVAAWNVTVQPSAASDSAQLAALVASIRASRLETSPEDTAAASAGWDASASSASRLEAVLPTIIECSRAWTLFASIGGTWSAIAADAAGSSPGTLVSPAACCSLGSSISTSEGRVSSEVQLQYLDVLGAQSQSLDPLDASSSSETVKAATLALVRNVRNVVNLGERSMQDGSVLLASQALTAVTGRLTVSKATAADATLLLVQDELRATGKALLSKCSVPGTTASFADAVTGDVVAVASDTKASAELSKVVASATFPSLPLSSVAEDSDVTRAIRSSAFVGASTTVDVSLGGPLLLSASSQLLSAVSASITSSVSSLEVSEQRSMVGSSACPPLLDADGNPTIENLACMPGDAAVQSCGRGSVPSGGVFFAGASLSASSAASTSSTTTTPYQDPQDHPAVRIVPASGAASGLAAGMATQPFSASLWVKRSSGSTAVGNPGGEVLVSGGFGVFGFLAAPLPASPHLWASSNTLTFAVAGVTGVDDAQPAFTSTGTARPGDRGSWVHWTVTYEPSLGEGNAPRKVYRNGAPEAAGADWTHAAATPGFNSSAAVAGVLKLTHSGGEMWLGAAMVAVGPSGSGGIVPRLEYAGGMDDFRLFRSTTLSASHVSSLYAATAASSGSAAAGLPVSPIVSLQFTEPAAPSQALGSDSSGNGHHATHPWPIGPGASSPVNGEGSGGINLGCVTYDFTLAGTADMVTVPVVNLAQPVLGTTKMTGVGVPDSTTPLLEFATSGPSAASPGSISVSYPGRLALPPRIIKLFFSVKVKTGVTSRPMTVMWAGSPKAATGQSMHLLLNTNASVTSGTVQTSPGWALFVIMDEAGGRCDMTARMPHLFDNDLHSLSILGTDLVSCTGKFLVDGKLLNDTKTGFVGQSVSRWKMSGFLKATDSVMMIGGNDGDPKISTMPFLGFMRDVSVKDTVPSAADGLRDHVKDIGQRDVTGLLMASTLAVVNATSVYSLPSVVGPAGSRGLTADGAVATSKPSVCLLVTKGAAGSIVRGNYLDEATGMWPSRGVEIVGLPDCSSPDSATAGCTVQFASSHLTQFALTAQVDTRVAPVSMWREEEVPPATNTTSPPPEMDAGSILGLAIGGLFFLAVLGAGIYYVTRKKAQQKMAAGGLGGGGQGGGLGTGTGTFDALYQDGEDDNMAPPNARAKSDISLLKQNAMGLKQITRMRAKSIKAAHGSRSDSGTPQVGLGRLPQGGAKVRTDYSDLIVITHESSTNSSTKAKQSPPPGPSPPSSTSSPPGGRRASSSAPPGAGRRKSSVVMGKAMRQDT